MADEDAEDIEKIERKIIRRPPKPIPQVFTMIRHRDETGVSGTGVVGSGVILSSGITMFEWFSATPSINQYPSFDAFLAVHIDPHPDNGTEIEWHLGGPEPEEEAPVEE